MAFTVEEARDLADNAIDEEISDDEALAWAKEFMRQKVDSRRWPQDTTEYTATADEDYDLPDDFVLPIEVRDENGYLFERYGYRSGLIQFAETGTFTLTYRKMPTVPTGVSDTLPLPDLYVDPLAYFMASRFRSKDDSEDSDAAKWMAECDMAIRNIVNTTRASSGPMRVRMRW